MRKRVIECLEEVGIPDADTRCDFYPHQLSGGQQQRVMIAMALACEPEILIADEPTTALDVTIQQQVLELIRELTRNRQLAVLLITHDMSVVFNTADEVAVMYQGEIIERAPVRDFFHSPREDYSRRLIDALPDLEHYQQRRSSGALLEVHDLKVHFPIRKGVLQRTVDYTRAVDGVSLSVDRGETYALVGESGSGKSTLGRAILRLETVTAGTVSFDGQALEQKSRPDMLPLRDKMQVIFQNPHASMNPRMTVGQIIEEGLISLKPNLSAAERAERLQSLMSRVQLEQSFVGRYPHELSGGQLQRVAIARALAVEPELIICDEPTSALDVSIRAGIIDLLKELQEQEGVSYLFITHDLSIVPTLAHHVGVMQAGKLVEQGSAEDILTRPQHAYTKALLASVPKLEDT
ncbi:MAG: dipeptide ABC transporter ATP-binding protein [Pseudomonadota bacterium]